MRVSIWFIERGVYGWGMSKGGKGRRKQACLVCCVHGFEARGMPVTKLACRDSTPKIEAAAVKYAYVK